MNIKIQKKRVSLIKLKTNKQTTTTKKTQTLVTQGERRPKYAARLYKHIMIQECGKTSATTFFSDGLRGNKWADCPSNVYVKKLGY